VHVNRFHIALVTVLVGGALVACTAHPSNNTALVCEARLRVETSLAVFLGLDPAISEPGDYVYAWDAVHEDYIDLQDYRDNMRFENASALDDAVADLEDAVNAIPDDATMTEAVDTIRDEIGAVQDALAAVDLDLDCPV
jgi:hypothetical protein